MGGVNSVETVLITTVADANNPDVIAKIRGAEALFIAGGDQANYVNFWKDTPVEDAINYLLITKKAPVGGTSAGCAILGSSYFSALINTVTSDEAMADPYNPLITLGHDDFLAAPYLQNTITDQHFSQRAREGRLVTFMARMLKARIKAPQGIAVDEQTAVCIDQNGVATVFGINNAFFLKTTGGNPELCVAGSPLTWNNNMQAISVYRISGNGKTNGNGSFDLKDFSTASGGTWLWFYVQAGAFFTN
jgi:cyanophycinase